MKKLIILHVNFVNCHVTPPLVHQLKSPVVIVVFDLTKENQFLAIIFPGIEHHHGNAVNDLMQVIEYGM